MTESETHTVTRLELVDAAFKLASVNCGSKARMLAALDITESWMHGLRKGATMTVTMALKLQVLTNAHYKWQDLCPEEHQKINAVADYLIN